ncbi:hypothetical protein GCM10011391_08710 [Pullulanibacillus camelliae]|uniref:Uncharacterized protein n=1 Tax=Pullulanibacillus camelliae TaxID=1707096 RepID=A0A8J2VNB6_9BACL|nr:hypothetical protein [Pullulanibacillus camelliae]GGE32303.1 hypothetical protein GCM10011391_08710 [Pullulanibacillus camelliae]
MAFHRLMDYLFRNSKEWQSATRQLKMQQETIQKLYELLDKLEGNKEERVLKSPTIIEHIHVDKVVVEHYKQSNNFGALGIKSLEGRLNIGANYGTTEPLTEKEKKEKSAYKKAKDDVKMKSQPPKTTIRSRSST